MEKNEAIKKWIDKCIEVMRRQHKSLATERAYVHWLRKYFAFVYTLPGGLTSEQKMERYLTQLAVKFNVSAATQNHAFNAILFFYKQVLRVELKNIDALRATRPERVRHAPTVEETLRLLETVEDSDGYPTNLVVRILYGAGLRVSEPIALRIKDIRIEESTIFIRGGKGQKDRVVRLPCSVVPGIQQQMAYARAIWERDRKGKIPVVLPHQLAKKYPEYEFAWGWAWLFPMRNPCTDPRSKRTVRWHMLPCTVQRAVKVARRKLGVMILPHELRHAFATHNLNNGVNMKALQVAMGHECIETTAGYCHADALSVPSPLDVVSHHGLPRASAGAHGGVALRPLAIVQPPAGHLAGGEPPREFAVTRPPVGREVGNQIIRLRREVAA